VIVAAALCALLSMSTAPAPSDGAIDPRLAQAITDYRALKLERAITTIDTFLFDGSISPSERAQALLLHGLCLAQLGEPVAARDRFVAAYEQEPNVTLAVPVPKKVQGLMDSARAEVLARGPPTSTQKSTETKNDPPVVDEARGGPSPAFIVGVTVASMGGAAAVGAGIATVIGAQQAGSSADPNATQREAVERAEAANAALAIAGVSAIAGALTIGVGAALIVFARE